jgi:hypothetical protein
MASFGRNNDVWSDLGPHARAQLLDARKNRTTTRDRVVRVNQQAARQNRINSALPEDAWVDMDDTTTAVVRDELRLVSDLRQLVGTHDVPINAKLDTWGITKTHGEAELGMDPDMATGESTVSFGEDGSPVPVAYDPFSVGFRDAPVDGSRMEGSLESQNIANSTRLVSQLIEQVFVDSSEFDIDVYDSDQGYDLYGMTDHPSTATGNTTSDWTVAGNESDIRSDFRDARSVLKNDRNYASGFGVYLGNEFYDELDDADPEGDGNQTVRDRVENLSGIQFVRELDALPEKSMLMFKPSPDVVEVGFASDVMPLQQEEMLADNFLLMGAMYPRIYQQYNVETESLQNGILYWTSP